MDSSIPNLLRAILRDRNVVRDPAVSLSREKMALACYVGVCQAADLFPSLAGGQMLDWLDAATESDIEWLFDPHGEPR